MTDLDGEPGGLAGCWLFFIFCDDTLAEFSNFGSVIDVTAPGTQIYSYVDRRRLRQRDGHEHGRAARGGRRRPARSPPTRPSSRPTSRTILKSTGECPNGEFADADGSGDCIGKGQWGNDPDGYGEPLVNALNAVEGGTPGDRRPRVEITTPADGATVSGSVSVTASATDDVGVTQVAFFVNGLLAATDTDGSNGWSMTWDTAVIPGGAYTLKATATDTIGQTGTDSNSVRVGTNVQGDWVGNYGARRLRPGQLERDARDLVSLPAGVTFTVEQASRYSWSASTTDVRALESPNQAERRARTWYDTSQIRLRLDVQRPVHRHAPPVCRRLGLRTAGARTSPSTTGPVREPPG